MNRISQDMIKRLKQEVEQEMGYSLKGPKDFDALHDKLTNKLKDTLGQSTLKRIWEYVPNKITPQLSTLSILARFLDYEDWDDFCANHISESEFISAKNMPLLQIMTNDVLEFTWHPKRRCRVRCIGEDQFEVVEAENCKLLVGDRFRATFFAMGHALHVAGLVRNGAKMPGYVAGKKNGLTSLEKIDPTV